jgi:hypothetical protein
MLFYIIIVLLFVAFFVCSVIFIIHSYKYKYFVLFIMVGYEVDCFLFSIILKNLYDQFTNYFSINLTIVIISIYLCCYFK